MQLEIDTQEVLRAAGTKWNSCRSPRDWSGGTASASIRYYLIRTCRAGGIRPRLMTEARRINDTMGGYVAARVVESMNRNGILVNGASVLILGFAFKENCPDVRNTKVEDIYRNLQKYTSGITVYDPNIDAREVMAEYGIEICTDGKEIEGKTYDAIIGCVSHSCFDSLDIQAMRKRKSIVYDIKGNIPKEYVTDRL